MRNLNITAAEYIAAAFPAELLRSDERVLVSRPMAPFIGSEGLPVHYNQHRAATPRLMKKVDRPITESEEGSGWLFAVSSVKPLEDGSVKARLSDVSRAFVFPLDDVGTKSNRSGLPPSVELETSPGNFQHHFFIEPFDVSTDQGKEFFDACLRSSAAAGINDCGVRSASRVMKLPNALHRTGFITKVTEWSPSRRWDLKDLMAALGLEVIVDAVRSYRSSTPGRCRQLEDVQDGVLDFLRDNGLIKAAGPTWLGIACPWESNHSSGHGSATSTSYSPLEYGATAGRAFKCLHGGCSDKSTADFLIHMRQRGAKLGTL